MIDRSDLPRPTGEELQSTDEKNPSQITGPESKLPNLVPLKQWWQEHGLRPELLDTLVENLSLIDRDLFDKSIARMAEDIREFAGKGNFVLCYRGGKNGNKRSGDFVVDSIRPYLVDCKDIEYVNIGDRDRAEELNIDAVQGRVSRLAYIDDWTLTGSQFLTTFSREVGVAEYLDAVGEKRAFFLVSSPLADKEIQRRVQQEQLGWDVQPYIIAKTVTDILPPEDVAYLQDKIPDAAGWAGWGASVMTYSFWKAPDNMPKLFTGADSYLVTQGLKPIIEVMPPYYRKK